MEIQKQVKLKFDGVDIVDLKFHSNKQAEPQQKVDVNVSAKVHYPIDDDAKFRIIIVVVLSAPDYYNLEVKAVGNFKLEGDFVPETRKSFVNVNAPAILFPFVRSFIATLTANLGQSTGPVLIQPHFFKGQIEEYIEGATHA